MRTQPPLAYSTLALPLLASLLAAPGVAQTPLFVLGGKSPGSGFSHSIAGAGDVDGDGCSDIVVGVPNESSLFPNSGAVRVYSGQTGMLLWEVQGPAPFDFLGSAVAGLGDPDKDGVPDIAVGTRGEDTAGNNAGAVHVLRGSDGAYLITLYGDEAGDALGTSLANIGDLNNDGIPDLAAGLPGSDAFEQDAGAVRVFSGKTGSVLLTVQGDSASERFGSVVAGSGDLDDDQRADLLVSSFHGRVGRVRVLSGASGKVLLTLSGNPTGDDFGRSIACIGDANGDGVEDMIVGAPLSDLGGAAAGSAFLLSGANGTILGQVSGTSKGDRLGASVAPAGDVNKDGRADFAVGMPGRDVIGPGGPPPGGGGDGDDPGDGGDVPGDGPGDVPPDDSDVGSGDAPGAPSSLQADAGVVRIYSGGTGLVLSEMDGPAEGALFGWSMAQIGDVNDDGIPEVALGALLDDESVADAGTVRIVSVNTLPLGADGHMISLSKGGKQKLSLALGSTFAGQFYWVIGGASGTTPGVNAGSSHVPLNFDDYTALSISNPLYGGVDFPIGILDANGLAAPHFVVPPGSDPFLEGISLHHALGVFDKVTTALIGVTNAVPLTLVK